MSEDELDKVLKASHTAIEDQIREHIANMEIKGVLTGWSLGVAITHFEEGEEYDGIFTMTSDGLSKWTNIGITTMMLDAAKDPGEAID